MHLEKSLGIARPIWLSLALLSVPGSLMIGGCGDRIIGDGDLSCPCDDTDTGAHSASGNLEIDGLLTATQSVLRTVSNSSASFEASLGRMESAWGVEGEGNLQSRIDALIAAIQLDMETNAGGGLWVELGEATCSANLTVLADAQARCEAQNDCDVEIDPTNVEVSCEGACVGACSGSCTAESTAYCRVKAEGASCAGSCDGVCETSGATACQGTCRGTCSGECTAYDSKGNCMGACDGDCSGICEIDGEADCNGLCTGSCSTESDGGQCGANAELRCGGACEGTCSGECVGQATLPSASAQCEASSDCQMQASAQASAEVECNPPTIALTYEFTGDVTAEAAFSAKVAVLQAEAPAMLAAFTHLKALIDGEVNGEVVFDPAPVMVVAQTMDSLLRAGIDGDLFDDVPAGRIPCVLPALEANVSLLGDVTGEATATLTAQSAFVAALASGFDT